MTMLLRIDDTDPARAVARGDEAIRLHWLGVEWDEGLVRAGDRAAREREPTLATVGSLDLDETSRRLDAAL